MNSELPGLRLLTLECRAHRGVVQFTRLFRNAFPGASPHVSSLLGGGVSHPCQTLLEKIAGAYRTFFLPFSRGELFCRVMIIGRNRQRVVQFFFLPPLENAPYPRIMHLRASTFFLFGNNS